MIYDEKASKFRLSNGKTIDSGANRAIGLDRGDLSVGFDEYLRVRGEGIDEEPTDAEKIEIAEYMIAEWTAYKESLTTRENHES